MTVEVELLGAFAVRRGGHAIPDGAWSRRHAAALVKLLALSPTRRLHREQVIDALWPELGVGEAAPRLHKAAHFARKAAGEGAIVLRGDSVALFPDEPVTVDVSEFEAAAADALRSGDEERLRAAADRCGGDVLPGDPYEEWVEASRQRVRRLRTDLLRRLGRWDDLVRLDPTDEEAHVALMRALAAGGDRHGALRQFERLDRALAGELGLAPGHEAVALRDSLLREGLRAEGPAAEEPGAGPAGGEGPGAGQAGGEVGRPGALLAGRAEPAAAGGGDLVGREAEQDLIGTLLRGVRDGEGGRTLLLAGAPGVGKSALLAWAREAAASQGWRTGQGAAAAIEGAWPYAPILEAVADLCRRHPTLLDGLDDNYRAEIERGLAGGDLHWSGEGGHQRLFVAVAELMRLAAGERGALLVLDDLQDADEATLRLTHYLARCAVTERIALLVAYRPAPSREAFEQFRASLSSRSAVVGHELAPLAPVPAEQLARRHQPAAGADTLARIVEIAGGSPFAIVELSRRAATAPAWEQSADSVTLATLPPTTREILQRVAVLGTTFDTDEFVALADMPDDEAFPHLDAALEAGVVEHTGTHFRFRHGLIREALTADVAPHRRRRIHRHAAARLEALGASPARIGHHLAEAGDPAAAAPHLVRAAERAAAIGAYRDAFQLVERVLAHVEGRLRARALTLRADLLFALGDPSASVAYRYAIELATGDERRPLRARLARAAVMAGDLDTAVAALDDLGPAGGPADGDIMLARSQVAFFTGDMETARSMTEEARRRVLGGDKSWQVLELVTLDGLLAHTRGEWFDRMRVELQRTRQDPELAQAIFDGYLCTAEYLLYGPTPYDEVIELAHGLRDTARRSGVLRAVAFAAALAGEAALLAGDLVTAQRELEEAVDLHHDICAAGGEAHSLQRLAEVRLAAGDPAEATRLLQRALPLARWTPISLHLLQRLFGTLILAAPDPDTARGVVDRAESTLGTEDLCSFCNIMLAVPAAIACADVGDLEHARHHLQVAERSLPLWEGTSWQAAVQEARAHLADAEGDGPRAGGLRAEAAALFEAAGQPLDAARCRPTATA